MSIYRAACKMVPTGGNCEINLFFLGLLLLTSPLAVRQQGRSSYIPLAILLAPSMIVTMYTVGVSLKLNGVSIPNNSIMDIDDILYRAPKNPHPNNTNGLQTLMCVTDLVDCCETEVLGGWYFPNGTGIPLHTGNYEYRTFLANRGPYEVKNGQQFNGSVCLWCRYSPIERGRFCCELPCAADPNVNQILYVNICEFNINEVLYSDSW